MTTRSKHRKQKTAMLLLLLLLLLPPPLLLLGNVFLNLQNSCVQVMVAASRNPRSRESWAPASACYPAAVLIKAVCFDEVLHLLG